MLKLALTLAFLSASAFAQTSPEELPEGKARDEVFYICAACHSFTIVSRQGMSRERWDTTFNFMVEKHNMNVIEGKDREDMLDYLAKNFPEKPSTGFKSPF